MWLVSVAVGIWGCTGQASPGGVDAGAETTDATSSSVDSTTPDAAIVEPDAGYLGECPADTPVDIQRLATPWSADDPANAYRVINIPTQAGRHYHKAIVDFDMDVTELSDMVAIWLLRNKQVPNTSPVHHWFGGSLKRNSRTVLYVNNFSGPEGNGQWIPKTWRFSRNTTYHVHYEYDALAETAVLRYTGADGSSLQLDGVAHASIAAAGAGLKFELGIPTSHPDYPTVQPPTGWSFYNLRIRLIPGGPFGAAAPCP